MFVCEVPGSDARDTAVLCSFIVAIAAAAAAATAAAEVVDRNRPSASLLVVGGSSEAVLGPRAGHATPGPSALVLRHACVGGTGGRVPQHRRKVAAAPGPGCANSGGARGTADAAAAAAVDDDQAGTVYN